MMNRLKVTMPLLAMAPALLLVGSSAFAQNAASQAKQEAEQEAKQQTTKATQTKADRDMTAKIRKAITDDKTLSAEAHKVGIQTREGKVTLSGRVASEDEKTAVVAKAKDIAGASNVTDKLTVAPPKTKKAGE